MNILEIKKKFLYISFIFPVSPFTFLFVSLLDQLHSVPIAQMGNYQDFLKLGPAPLREVDPDQPKRLHTFGNPFKLDKKVERI